MKGYLRVAACAPKVVLADCEANVRNIINLTIRPLKSGCRLVVFPEMSVTGYTCGDLFHDSTLLDGALAAMQPLSEFVSEHDMVVVVGAPYVFGGQLYNCAFVFGPQGLIAIVPKTYLPNYNEFYEKRWWQPAPEGVHYCSVPGLGENVPFGTNILIDIDGVKIGVEICEDLWTPIPPSCYQTMAGAHVVANLSASDDITGKYAYLRSLIAQQSARCICGYVYASAGFGESSTDLVFDGKAVIAENGSILQDSVRFADREKMTIVDIDIAAIEHDRRENGSFNATALRNPAEFITIPSGVTNPDKNELMRKINPRPFVPATSDAFDSRCEEIVQIQKHGLMQRLDFIHCSKLVVGISGGLDSTLALLIAVNAFDALGLDRKGIIGVTMPGFGTTGRTYNNAMALMQALGITIREVSITAAVTQHFSDIGHDAEVHDVTYENSQARERTQILMDIANQVGGIVLGTGDLSELALGWATYNGDHMSMYGVNAGVPKTLVRTLVAYLAQFCDEAAAATLTDIIDTPISPELIPADADGNIAQKTEDLVGPYELHDFFLYYMLRYGFTPARIYGMACHAFGYNRAYPPEVIKHWLRTFYRRFFQQQFKRSCLPDGPKVGSVCLSPRGDWRMPSDASARLWLEQIDNL